MNLPRSHRSDFIAIATGTTTWAILCAAVLFGTGSKLPNQLLRRKS